MKKIAASILAVLLLTMCVSVHAEDVIPPEMEELGVISAWIGTQITEEEQADFMNWDAAKILEKLEAYDGELKYNTKESAAQALEAQLVMLRSLAGSMEDMMEDDMSGFFYMIEPAYDGTVWANGHLTIRSVCENGSYVLTVDELDESVARKSYLCTLSEDSLLLTSTGTAFGEEQADQGLGSTFLAQDQDEQAILVWTDAEGKEETLYQYCEAFISAFVSEHHAMTVTFRDGFYSVSIGESLEAIANNADGVLTFTCVHPLNTMNLYTVYSEDEPDASFVSLSDNEDGTVSVFSDLFDDEVVFTKQ